MIKRWTTLVLKLAALIFIGFILLTSVAEVFYCSGPLREIAAQRASAYKLWLIGKALRAYQSRNGQLPPLTSHDVHGSPLLSWRVHLLPFLGEEKLYRQFHLDEPWDSKNNAPLILKMPNVYNFDPGNRNADVGDCFGKTCYVALTGANTLFSTSEATGSLAAEQMDSKRIIVVEADEASAKVWSKPEDAVISEPSPERIGGVSGRRKGKVLALLANGWVALASPDSLGDKEASKVEVVLKEIIEEPEGGEPVHHPLQQENQGNSQSKSKQ